MWLIVDGKAYNMDMIEVIEITDNGEFYITSECYGKRVIAQYASRERAEEVFDELIETLESAWSFTLPDE